MEKREIHSVLTDFLNERLMQVTASGQAEKNDFLKAKIRPVLTKGVLHFQAEEFIGKSARSTGSWNLLRTCFRSLIRIRRPGSLILAVESLI